MIIFKKLKGGLKAQKMAGLTINEFMNLTIGEVEKLIKEGYENLGYESNDCISELL